MASEKQVIDSVAFGQPNASEPTRPLLYQGNDSTGTVTISKGPNRQTSRTLGHPGYSGYGAHLGRYM